MLFDLDACLYQLNDAAIDLLQKEPAGEWGIYYTTEYTEFRRYASQDGSYTNIRTANFLSLPTTPYPHFLTILPRNDDIMHTLYHDILQAGDSLYYTLNLSANHPVRGSHQVFRLPDVLDVHVIRSWTPDYAAAHVLHSMIPVIITPTFVPESYMITPMTAYYI